MHISHVEGKNDIADLFTKEMKDTEHCLDMVEMVTSPRLLHANPLREQSISTEVD